MAEVDYSSGSESPTLKSNSDYLKEFILSYESHPSLWDPNNKNYKDKIQRNRDLDKLLIKFKKIKPNATREDVRRKVNSLRSNYRKELKKIEESKSSGHGADEVYKPTSITFHLLKFLAKIDNPLLTKKENSDSDEEKTDCSSMYLSLQNEDLSPPKRKKTIKGLISKHNESISRRCSLPLPSAEIPHQNVDPLALVWSEKIKKLNPTQRLYAEKAINDVLFEAELNNLTKQSVQINNLVPAPSSASSSMPYTFIPAQRVVRVPENFKSLWAPVPQAVCTTKYTGIREKRSDASPATTTTEGGLPKS